MTVDPPDAAAVAAVSTADEIDAAAAAVAAADAAEGGVGAPLEETTEEGGRMAARTEGWAKRPDDQK